MHVPILCIPGLVGMALGLRFRAFVILPATAIAVITGTWFDVITGASRWTTILFAVLVAAAVQAGYFVGSALRDPKHAQRLLSAVYRRQSRSRVGDTW